jgi:hypothetical protein
MGFLDGRRRGRGLCVRVVNLKFIEEQPQILRLTTPKLKKRLGSRSLRMTADIVLRISDAGH